MRVYGFIGQAYFRSACEAASVNRPCPVLGPSSPCGALLCLDTAERGRAAGGQGRAPRAVVRVRGAVFAVVGRTLLAPLCVFIRSSLRSRDRRSLSHIPSSRPPSRRSCGCVLSCSFPFSPKSLALSSSVFGVLVSVACRARCCVSERHRPCDSHSCCVYIAPLYLLPTHPPAYAPEPAVRHEINTTRFCRSVRGSWRRAGILHCIAMGSSTRRRGQTRYSIGYSFARGLLARSPPTSVIACYRVQPTSVPVHRMLRQTLLAAASPPTPPPPPIVHS
ncbi:hypothetical protein C8Q77DRAFT_644903 [Trametes polyzona]|nr:hypothetical protein C8Q77DRAFT_644903 [Trametes polyzona]